MATIVAAPLVRVRRCAVVAAIVAALLVLSGCGGDEPPAIVEESVGTGVQQATILRPGGEGPFGVVLFLHGWGGIPVDTYRPWLEHLARRGSAVIYPRYQESFAEPPPQVLGNVLAGVRAALGRVRVRPETLVAAGHSAGAALAADYAAAARPAGLPVPRAVFAAYPGRRLPGVAFAIPEVDPSAVPRSTRVVALAGTGDRVVGTRPARRLARATGGELVLVDDPAARDHLAPQRADAAARRIFWTRLDALVAAAR